MESKRDDVSVLEGLDTVRARPAMYIGPALPDKSLHLRLVECAVDGVASDTPAPSAVRLVLWRAGVYTVAFDGEPLPVQPFVAPWERREGRVVIGVSHPELYRFFLYVGAHPSGRTLSFAGGAINALSERLVVTTVVDGARYRAAFSKGMLVSLLHKTPSTLPHGTTSLTFLPDPSIIAGEPLTLADAESIADRARAASGGVQVTTEDRTTETADWT